jgi:hypothetical protein
MRIADHCGHGHDPTRRHITGDDRLNQHGSGGGQMSLREVLVGLVEEYARHMDHADLLRERIDGRLGQ